MHSVLLKRQLEADGYDTNLDESIKTVENAVTTRTRGVAEPSQDWDEMDDEAFFEAAQAGQIGPIKKTKTAAEIGRAHSKAQAVKYLANRHLSNAIMNLRKIVNHPALFHDRPLGDSSDVDLDKHSLLASSGKMLLLNRLLFGEKGLFATGHKVVLFSQCEFSSVISPVRSNRRECSSSFRR